MAASARRVEAMHENVIGAIEALQGRVVSTTRHGDGEVLEEALSDLVRNPERESDVDHQTGSAVARARTKLKRRRNLIGPIAQLDASSDGPASHRPLPKPPVVDDSDKHKAIFVEDALARGLSRKDRTLLDLVDAGFTATELAEIAAVNPSRIRVRLSRARARARRTC
jgi:hypothetical protein